MLRDLSVRALVAGVLAAFVGFASSFAVIVNGLAAVGATQAQAASGLLAISVAMGVCGIVVSLRLRMPISVAWTTPGGALLATTGAVAGGFPAAVGAFLLCGGLIVVSGLFRPLGRWVAAIPAPLASAMMAGVLLNLCLAPVRAVAETPVLALPVVVVWAVVARLKRVFAVPAAVIVAVGLIALTTHADTANMGSLWPVLVPVWPAFSVASVVGIAVPLFIVTMASQNIPGMAVLRVNGFAPPAPRLFRATGLASIVAAPFGSPAINLAAITAAMCAGEDAHPDPTRRYWAAVSAGVMYVLLGLGAAAATAFLAASPPILIEAVAGLALFGAFGGAMMSAVAEPSSREAAVVTFLVTGSGVTLFGISGAFWGLVAGGALLALGRWRG
jgi:benzoate membrane transport protein